MDTAVERVAVGATSQVLRAPRHLWTFVRSRLAFWQLGYVGDYGVCIVFALVGLLLELSPPHKRIEIDAEMWANHSFPLESDLVPNWVLAVILVGVIVAVLILALLRRSLALAHHGLLSFAGAMATTWMLTNSLKVLS